MTKSTNPNAPTHRVYAVTKKNDADKGHWAEIGAVWPHKDGKGFKLKLDLLPTGNADLVIRLIEAEKGGAA